MMRKATFRVLQGVMKALSIVLSLCFILTSVILVYCMTRTSQPEIPSITLSLEEQEQKVPEESSWGAAAGPSDPQPAAPSASQPAAPQNFKPGFEVEDANGLWVAETPVEIFKITYANGESKVTVNGNGDKVIAPGTENAYSFTLKNTGNVQLKYTMSTEVLFSDPELHLPVQVRMKNYDGQYLCGSAEGMEHASVLNTVSDTATLDAYSNAVYSLEWEWPFESGGEGDVHDTLLGDTATERDISMTVIIRTRAEADYNEYSPNTGGYDLPRMAAVAVGFLLLLMIVLVGLVLLKKKGK